MTPAQKIAAVLERADLSDIRSRLGECYRYAGERFLNTDLPGLLVHGRIRLAGRPIKHAWIEWADGTCWDPTTDSEWTVGEYAEVFGAEKRVEYSRHRAAALALSLCHFGPWDDFPEYEDEWHPRAMSDTEGL